MGKKKSRPHKVSGGLRQQRKARRLANKLKKRVARWEKYQQDPEKSKLRSWKTDGLKRHIKVLERVAAKPPKHP